MPFSACCTNCRTKYSLLNREAGCSNCALSFCKKCLGYRSIIPTLSDQPMIVCYDCYQKLEASKKKPNAIITSTPLPTSSGRQTHNKNWWGDGLPPPSFRSTYENQNWNENRTATSQQFKKSLQSEPQNHQSHYPIDDLEQRRAKLREDVEPTTEPLSISEIEERLAKLRECDVELIRNPKSWISSSTAESAMNANTPAELIRGAENLARIKQKEEDIERTEWEKLEARRQKIFEDDLKEENNDGASVSVRGSVVSGSTEFSEATKEEINEINNLLNDAEKRVSEIRKEEENSSAMLKSVMKATRQKSLDAMQWNEKITKEIGSFWDRRNEKEATEEDSEDDQKSLDNETFQKILIEAENSVDIEPSAQRINTEKSSIANVSPKKKGFFEKLFRKDSKQ